MPRSNAVSCSALLLGYLTVVGCAAPMPVNSSATGDEGKADRWDDLPDHCPNYQEPNKLAVVRSDRADELSGLVASRDHPGILWSHNDSGGTRHLIAFSVEGDPHGNYKLVGSKNRDWEDIAIGPGHLPFRDYLYVADIGDNEREHDELVVYRVAEPEVGDVNDDAFDLNDFETFKLFYGDGDQHDAESFAIDPETGNFFIVTKAQKGDRETLLFVAEAPFEDGGTYKLSLVAHEDDYGALKGQASGADFTVGGSRVGLQFEDHVKIWSRPSDGWSNAALEAEPCLGPVPDAQIESFAWAIDRPGYYLVPEGKEPNLYHVAP